MQVDEASFVDLFNVSRETIERLEKYEALLAKWNPRINLVSRTTLDNVWHRHFADSAQIWRLATPSAKKWLDFGSGAGFPGLVCAVMAKEVSPELKFVLVESDQRKAAFLMSVSNELGLNVEIKSNRIEALESQNADIISARAVASLGKLLEYSAPHGHKSTVLLFPKGVSYESELTAAQKHWHIEPKVVRSLTDSNSVILRIEGLKRAK